MPGWHSTSRHARGYGSAWVKLRDRIMARDNHLCQPCLRKGRPTQAQAVDHIIPKAKGGTDDEANLEATCNACHDVKTQQEGHPSKARMGIDGWPTEPIQHGKRLIPDRIPKPRCDVTLIFGPPAAGKTTWAKAQAKPDDIIIDLDDIKVSLGGKRWDTRGEVIRQALRARDNMIRNLPAKGRAYVILTGQTPEERKAWAEALSADVVIIAADQATCLARIRADPARRDAMNGQAKAVRLWFTIN